MIKYRIEDSKIDGPFLSKS